MYMSGISNINDKELVIQSYCIILADGTKVIRVVGDHCIDCDVDNYEIDFYTDELGNKITEPDLTDATSCPAKKEFCPVLIRFTGTGILPAVNSYSISPLNGFEYEITIPGSRGVKIPATRTLCQGVEDCNCICEGIRIQSEGELLIEYFPCLDFESELIAPLSADYNFTPGGGPNTDTIIVNVAVNSTPCILPQITTFQLIPGSEVNATVTDISGGNFEITPLTTAVWSFQYEIYCDALPSGQIGTVTGNNI